MKNLKKIAKARNKSLTSLAVELGISQEAISQYISGKISPKISVIIKMSQILNVSVDYLLDLTDDLANSNFKLNENELALIENYRKLDGKGKAKAEAYLQAMVDFSDEKNKGFPL